VVVVSAPVLWDPLSPSLPLQPPDAAQEVALVETQVSVAVPPLAIVPGLADKVSVGNGAVTATLTDWLALPPGPAHVSTYVSSVVRGPVVCEPLKPFCPDQPPDAVQVVALADDHVNVEAAPLLTVVWLAVRLTVGAAGVTDTVVD
jgi:hypothetical protein